MQASSASVAANPSTVSERARMSLHRHSFLRSSRSSSSTSSNKTMHLLELKHLYASRSPCITYNRYRLTIHYHMSQQVKTVFYKATTVVARYMVCRITRIARTVLLKFWVIAKPSLASKWLLKPKTQWDISSMQITQTRSTEGIWRHKHRKSILRHTVLSVDRECLILIAIYSVIKLFQRATLIKLSLKLTLIR